MTILHFINIHNLVRFYPFFKDFITRLTINYLLLTRHNIGSIDRIHFEICFLVVYGGDFVKKKIISILSVFSHERNWRTQKKWAILQNFNYQLTKTPILPNCQVPNTEGPRLTLILGLGNNRVTWNSCKWDYRGLLLMWKSPICTYISQKPW